MWHSLTHGDFVVLRFGGHQEPQFAAREDINVVGVRSQSLVVLRLMPAHAGPRDRRRAGARKGVPAGAN